MAEAKPDAVERVVSRFDVQLIFHLTSGRRSLPNLRNAPSVLLVDRRDTGLVIPYVLRTTKAKVHHVQVLVALARENHTGVA